MARKHADAHISKQEKPHKKPKHYATGIGFITALFLILCMIAVLLSRFQPDADIELLLSVGFLSIFLGTLTLFAILHEVFSRRGEKGMAFLKRLYALDERLFAWLWFFIVTLLLIGKLLHR